MANNFKDAEAKIQSDSDGHVSGKPVSAPAGSNNGKAPMKKSGYESSND